MQNSEEERRCIQVSENFLRDLLQNAGKKEEYFQY
ncbi:unnamed protein product [Larinioides sclopetarius]|uniref:Maturase K n=1 Tax=Larinioides sclopetarius TaxID=280406 RepID=A0AAV2AEN2_9ARAC